jgi:hypothetical protein
MSDFLKAAIYGLPATAQGTTARAGVKTFQPG